MHVRAWLLVALVALAACGDTAPKVDSSGDPELDQTAQFLLWTLQRTHGRFPDPVMLVEYVCSGLGKAELAPPNPSTEPDAASAYTGLRPADQIGWGCARAGVLPREIVLSVADGSRTITATAYQTGRPNPLYTWHWDLD